MRGNRGGREESPFRFQIPSDPPRKDIDKWDFLIRHRRPRFTVQNWTNIFGNLEILISSHFVVQGVRVLGED